MVLVRTLKAGVGQGSSTLEFAFSDMNRTLMNLRIKSDSLFFWGSIPIAGSIMVGPSKAPLGFSCFLCSRRISLSARRGNGTLRKVRWKNVLRKGMVSCQVLWV
jgi:hypothetical protein